MIALEEHQHAIMAYLHQQYEEKKGLLSFADFMNIALYAPGLGYYSAGKIKIGQQGDFVTAPEISPLFSQCVANQCKQLFHSISNPSILELGAGTGSMAAEIILSLEKHQALPQQYYILEVSADLKAQQQDTLKEAVPHFYPQIKWLDTLESFSMQGIILANEVIDALPVHLFKIGENHSILEGRVVFQDNHWKLIYDEPLTEGLVEAVQLLQETLEYRLPLGYTSEISLLLMPWIKSLSSCLNKGTMLFIDYGFLAHEYYHPSRSMGTLMCHSRHRAHPDPLFNIGLQDITSHVDFTLLSKAAQNAGLTVQGFTTQATFLLSNQLLNIAEQNFSEDVMENVKLSQQIQTLTAPHEMGEIFKVMALGWA